MSLVRVGSGLEKVVLKLAAPAVAGLEVEAAMGDRQLAVTLTDESIEIVVPADLEPGRHELALTANLDVDVISGFVHVEEEMGVAAAAEGGWAMRGAALVDCVLPVEPSSRLEGRIRLRRQADADASEALELYINGGLRWRSGDSRSYRLSEDIAVDDDGFARLTFRSGAAIEAQLVDMVIRRPAPGPQRHRPVTGPALDPPRLVLVYVMDALRADRVAGFGGSAEISPTWAQLADEGVIFRSHRSVAPNTLPSTKALLAGRVWRDRGGWSLPDSELTLAEHYQQAGYRTALFSNNPYVSAKYGVAQGFEVARSVRNQASSRTYHDDAERLHPEVLDWLRSLSPGDKAFIYLHVLHPHNPYAPPRELERLHVGAPSSIDGSTRTLMAIQRGRRSADPVDRARIEQLYEASVAYADAQLGHLLTEVEKLIPRQQTLLVVTSDHGEELFDHGGVLHGYTLYEEQLSIPLLLRWSGTVAGGRQEDQPTDTLDLHETLLALVSPSRGEGRSGRQLWPLMQSGEQLLERPHFAAAASLKGGIFSSSRGSLKAIWAPRQGRQWGQGQGVARDRRLESCFRLDRDRDELDDLSGVEAVGCHWLWRRLESWSRPELTRPDEELPQLDEETRKRLESLGYLD